MKDNDEIAATTALLLVSLLLAHSYYSPQLCVHAVRSGRWEGLRSTYFAEHSRGDNQEAQTLTGDLLQEG